MTTIEPVVLAEIGQDARSCLCKSSVGGAQEWQVTPRIAVSYCRCGGISDVRFRCSDRCEPDRRPDASDGASMTCQKCWMPTCVECCAGPTMSVLSICDVCVDRVSQEGADDDAVEEYLLLNDAADRGDARVAHSRNMDPPFW